MVEKSGAAAFPNENSNPADVNLTIKAPPLKRLKQHLDSISTGTETRPLKMAALSPRSLKAQLKEDEGLLLEMLKEVPSPGQVPRAAALARLAQSVGESARDGAGEMETVVQIRTPNFPIVPRGQSSLVS